MTEPLDLDALEKQTIAERGDYASSVEERILALISLARELEDALDVAQAELTEARAAAKGEKPIPWDEAKKSLKP
jgi:hypothetical protein